MLTCLTIGNLQFQDPISFFMAGNAICYNPTMRAVKPLPESVHSTLLKQHSPKTSAREREEVAAAPAICLPKQKYIKHV
jgi:hypothetical protein